MSWISPDQAFVLGAVECGGNDCTAVVGTTDGGSSWHALGSLPAPLGIEQKTGVTGIRFADALHGWAFEPSLWSTDDGGVTWQQEQPPGGRLVLALGGDADGMYAVVSPCPYQYTNCGLPVTLWRTVPGSGAWSQVLTLPPFSGFGEITIAATGPVAYVAVPTPGSYDPDVLEVTLDGERWTARTDPCNKQDGDYLSSVAPMAGKRVALLCQSDIGFGKANKRVLRSSDAAATTTPAGTMPLYGIITQLAASPKGTVVAATYSIGSWIYRNAGGETWTTPVDLGDGGMGWNDVTFVSNSVAYVIHGQASCCGGGPGELVRSTDGGQTWRGFVILLHPPTAG
ncbi:MAG TPA: hypothetical protein VKA30_05225 [Actinomycetota bacterium]|nr:hypothetical protein [Actinomycetota bacterium]